MIRAESRPARLPTTPLVFLAAMIIAGGLAVCPSAGFAQTKPLPGMAHPPKSGHTTTGEANSPEASGLEQLDLSLLLNPEIQSASLISERVGEAPAPVTVITSQMIEAIGARNLQEVLTTYVPGMTEVADKNELNVAMRGIYTTSQQKILVMINNHRINSRTFSSAAPDFSIGIQPSKIKQIEVVRGPGSAVYGNLALNGVINIVTKDPAEVTGVDLEAGLGNFGQTTVDGVVGKRLSERASFMVWGSYYRADGSTQSVSKSEQFNIKDDPNPDAYFMAFKDPPSFDVGGRLSFGDFELFADVRQGKWVPSFSSGAAKGGQTYDYQDFRSWNGVKPGLASFNTHSELSYDHALNDRLEFDSSAYFDTNRTDQRLVVTTVDYTPQQQVSTAVGWSEWSLGNITKLTLNYDLGAVGRGNLVGGAQVDHMNVSDSYWVTGVDGNLDTVSDRPNKMLPEGANETIYSGFAQLKHEFGYNHDIILNAGVRYDYKDRYDYQYVNERLDVDKHVGDNVDAVSPRVALILAPDNWFGLKFAYSESFVDAPFFQRSNRTRNFRGSPDLAPERMRAFQLAPTFRGFDNHFRNTTNFYYLEHEDIIFRDKDAGRKDSLFNNSGQLNVAGIEDELAFLARDYRIRANASFQKPILSESYGVVDGQITNVPPFVGNLILDVKPLWFAADNVWLSLAGRYFAAQKSPIDITYKGLCSKAGCQQIEYQQPDRTVDDYLLLRSSLRWNRLGDSRFSLQATVNNILDTTYYQGGTTSHPYRQPGRWFMAYLKYDYDL